MPRAPSLALAVSLLAGCSSPPGSPAGATDPCKEHDCSNVVDAVLVPMLARNGLPFVVEDSAILCRRLAVDLNGIVPSPSEIAAQCVGHSAKEMAAYFMGKPSADHVPDGSPPYVFVNRRWWADRFQYQSGTNPASTWYVYVRDLDALVGDLYAGRIAYDVFARRALASPAFARRFGIFEANHDLVQIASQAFRVFLGREALPSEAEDFGNLWRGWTTKFMDEATSEADYADCPVTYDAQMNRNGCRHYELGLDGSQCAGVREASCQSTVLGPGEVLPSTNGFVRHANLAAADQQALETPGAIFVAQPEFAEAAVDAALARYLGWWKAGVYRPDFDLPAVRDALVAKFVADRYDVRKLDNEIVTSLAYTQAASLQQGENPLDPIWAFGPSKMMYGEAWFDSVGQAAAKQVGSCDFRYNGNGASKIAGLFPNNNAGYAATVRSLGGCPVASEHGDAGGLVPAITRRVALANLCKGAFRPAKGTSLEALVDLEFSGVGRAPTAAEKQAIVARLGVAADGGCDPTKLASCNLQPVADALCTSLYASALFTYY